MPAAASEMPGQRPGAKAGAAWQALAWGLVVAWASIFFLSNSFFQEATAVRTATLSSAATALAALAAANVALALSNGRERRLAESRAGQMGAPGETTRPRPSPQAPAALLVAGLLALAAASPASSLLSPALLQEGAAGWGGVLYGLAIGALAGLGLGALWLSALARLAAGAPPAPPRALAAGAAFGACLFLSVMALVPPDSCAAAAGTITLAATVPGLLALRPGGAHGPSQAMASPAVKARGLALGGLEADGRRLWAAYVALSGLLLGYCYNIYPKTTRFAGTAVAPGVNVLAGTASTPGALLFLVLAAIAAAAVLTWRFGARDKRFLRLGCLGIVCLAAVYFCLPLMPQGVFELLVGMAMLASAPAAARSLRDAALGRARESLQGSCAWLAGLLVGDALSAAFIELTVPESSVSAPVAVQTFAIVGTATVCFAALFIVAYAVVSTAYFPGPSGARLAGDGPGPAEAAAALAAAYGLSPREAQVVALLLRGRSGPYISEELGLSKSTVKTHIRHLYAKLGVSSKQELIDLAQRAAGEPGRPDRAREAGPGPNAAAPRPRR